MRHRSLFLAPALGGVLTACTLFTDLSGFRGGAGADADEGGVDASSSPDAPSIDAPQGGDAPSSSAYAAAVLQDKPLAYWRLGDAMGPTAKEELGLHPGVYSGALTFGAAGALAGDPNPAVGFDGSSSRLDVGGAFSFALKAAFSLEVWVRPRLVDTQERFIASSASRTVGSGDGYRLSFTSDFIAFRRTGAGANAYAETGALTPGRYQHIVATYDGMSIRLYIDGTPKDSGSSLQQLAAPADSALIFGGGAAGPSSNLDGELDEIAVYGAALSAERVRAHFMAAGN